MGASLVATHHAHTPSAVEGGRVISEMPVLGLTYGQAMQIKDSDICTRCRVPLLPEEEWDEMHDLSVTIHELRNI